MLWSKTSTKKKRRKSGAVQQRAFDRPKILAIGTSDKPVGKSVSFRLIVFEENECPENNGVELCEKPIALSRANFEAVFRMWQRWATFGARHSQEPCFSLAYSSPLEGVVHSKKTFSSRLQYITPPIDRPQVGCGRHEGCFLYATEREFPFYHG